MRNHLGAGLACASLLLTLLGPAPAAAQEAAFVDPDQAVLALRELVVVESALLASAEAERLANLDDLRQAANELSRAAGEMTSAIELASSPDPSVAAADSTREALAEAASDLSAAELRLERLVAASRAFGSRIQGHADRLARLQQRLRSLESSASLKRGPLAGTWRLSIGPSGDTGVLRLRQFGTLLSGQYSLASGRDGSARGTFVADKVTLEVIDASYGREATFHGVYSPSPPSIEGSWEALRLGTGRPAFGNWSAVKQEEPDEPAAPAESTAEDEAP